MVQREEFLETGAQGKFLPLSLYKVKRKLMRVVYLSRKGKDKASFPEGINRSWLTIGL